MNGNKSITIVVVIIIAAFAWKYWPTNVSPNRLLPTAPGARLLPSPTPTPEPTIEIEEPTPEATIDSFAENGRAAVSGQTDHPAKCLDGSEKTIVSQDENQIHYRCASGSVGSSLNLHLHTGRAK